MVSLPRSPTMRSMPGPPSSVSLSSPPLRKSAPAPALMLSRPVPPLSSIAVGVAGSETMLSSPPLALRTRRSVSGPTSSLKGAGLTRSKRHAAGDRRGREVLGVVAAVELGVVAAAGAAVHDVVVITGVPDHDVVAGVAVHGVVGVVAGDPVVAAAAVERVEVVAAVDDVVVGRAVDDVVAVAAVDRDPAQERGGDRDGVGARRGRSPSGRTCCRRWPSWPRRRR